jgi:outer membrane murein-binding lipoprotein Lpp
MVSKAIERWFVKENFLVSAAVVMVLLFCGCTQYPMGLSEEQWFELSPAQQADYQARQYQIDEQRRQQAEAARIQRAQMQAEAERMERERIDALYANAQYGDVIIVSICGGVMKRNNDLVALEPVAFDLVRGETKEVEFRGPGDRYRSLTSRYRVRLSEDGHTFYFNSDARDRIALVDDGWDRGRSYPVAGHSLRDINAGSGGMTIGIRLKELPRAPQRVIIEHR